MIGLLQQHTVDLYQLSDKRFIREKVKARSLLTVERFDLFAKLSYIKLRDSNPLLAKEIYNRHIRTFNPDLKEPGRTDKNSFEDFINAFDSLIDHFKKHDFDETVSLLPVSQDGTILDGSHRLAVLAFYDKDVTILRFLEVKQVCQFDYNYFIQRGLSRSTADQMALDALEYFDNIYVACYWSKTGNLTDREFALSLLKEKFSLLYSKNMRMSLQDLSVFMTTAHLDQSLLGTKETNSCLAQETASKCYGNNGILQFVMFQSDSLDSVLVAKDEIIKFYKLSPSVAHITNNQMQTLKISKLVLMKDSKDFSLDVNSLLDRLDEFKLIFKNVYLMKAKQVSVNFLGALGLYKK